jgi:excisionase family DNA binding protein
MKSDNIPLKLFIQLKIIVRDSVKEAFQEYEKMKSNIPTIPNDDFLSADQAAKYLKIQLSTLYSKVEKGEIPYYRSGKRKLLFSLEELREYIKNRKS